MIEKLSYKITRKPKLIVLIAVLLLIPSILGYAGTRVNYDILSYLPQDYNSSKGEKILEEPFHLAATTMLIVEDMPAKYTDNLRSEIEKVPGVSNAIWVSSMVGIQIPQDMIPESVKDMLYSGDSTMLVIQYDKAGASQETMNAIEQVRSLCNKNCFLAGFSVVTKDTRDLMNKELPLYLVVAVALSVLAMFVTLDSWLLPFAFMASIGLAIMYNMGSNIFLGEISYITKAIAAVLQLGVTMDYSIFLFRRYEEDLPKYDDKRDAMAQAIQEAFLSLSGGSLTTVAGFIALCFMQLTLGRDIGIVMAKGVFFGVVTVILVLPAILLVFDKPIEEHRHKTLIPNFGKVNNFVIKNRKKLAIFFLLLFIPAIYSQNHAPIYYKLDESLPRDLDSIVANGKLKDEFNMATSHFLIVDDSIANNELKEMTQKIKEIDGVTTVLSYSDIMSSAIPEYFMPQDILSICKQDGKQIMMINSNFESASDDVSQQIDEIRDVVNEYDKNSYLTGEAAMTDDLITTANVDFKVTNYISIAAIFIIIMILFKSITVPVILVATIELAIFINQGIPYFTGTLTPFISPTVIGCIQLGATVDYAILMTTRFREEIQNGHDRFEAIRIASTASDASIITSSLVLFCATLGVGMISKIGIVSNICMMLARGAIISALVSIFIMPAVLAVCEPLIAKTSLHWRKPKAKKEAAVAVK